MANEKKMDKVKIKAFAKVNLVLDVIGRRPDGYHEVEMILQSIDLHDELELIPASTVSLAIKGQRLPVDDRNIIVRTVKKLLAHAGLASGVRILLRKSIPVGAGLGGGSADAAATLVGLNRLWGLGLSQPELERIGATLGADIPFCLRGGTVLATGIGEKLTDLPSLPSLPVFLAKPPFNVSTAQIYKNLSLTAADHHPEVKRIATLIQQGDYQAIPRYWGNRLEEVTLELYPELKTVMDWLLNMGLPVRMSGSGPTLFVFGADWAPKRQAQVAATLRRKGWWTYNGFLKATGLEVN
jgi:4-diphosphocytidyl-2-C-methyl-D-erythritol kinase